MIQSNRVIIIAVAALLFVATLPVAATNATLTWNLTKRVTLMRPGRMHGSGGEGRATPAHYDRSLTLNVHSKLNAGWQNESHVRQVVETYGAAFGRDINAAGWVAQQAGPAIKGDPTAPVNATRLAELCAQFPQTSAVNQHLADTVWPAGTLNYIESLNSLFWFEKNAGRDPINFEANATRIADYYATYVSLCVNMDPHNYARPFGKIVEGMNEPDGELQPFGFWDKNGSTIERVIEIHRMIAAQNHKRFGRGNVSTAGPTGCDLELNAKNFSSFPRWWGRFLKEAFANTTDASSGDSIDLMSIHMYDNFNPKANVWHRQRVGSNVQAVLDLLCAYAHQVHSGLRIAFEVSEFGTSFANWKTMEMPFTNRHIWEIMCGVNGKILEYFDRADELAKAVPFLVHDGAFWSHDHPDLYPWTLFNKTGYDPKLKEVLYEWTLLQLFYELWAPFKVIPDGRIWLESDNANVQAMAFHDAATSTISMAVCNVLNATATVRMPDGFAADVQEGERRRLVWNPATGAPELLTETVRNVSGASISLEPNECSVFTLSTGGAVVQNAIGTAVVNRYRYYATPTILRLNSAGFAQFRVVAADAGGVLNGLRVCLANGNSDPVFFDAQAPSVSIAGRSVSRPLPLGGPNHEFVCYEWRGLSQKMAQPILVSRDEVITVDVRVPSSAASAVNFVTSVMTELLSTV